MVDMHKSHKTRFSMGASSWDEICIFCGYTDVAGGGWGKLGEPCTATPEEREARRWDDKPRADQSNGGE